MNIIRRGKIKILLYKSVLLVAFSFSLSVEVLAAGRGIPLSRRSLNFRKLRLTQEEDYRWDKLSKREQIERALEGREEDAPVHKRKQKARPRSASNWFSKDVSREESLKIIGYLTRNIDIPKDVERILIRVIEGSYSIRVSLKNLARVIENNEHINIWSRGIQTVIWSILDLEIRVNSTIFLMNSPYERKRRIAEYKKHIRDLANWLSDDNFSNLRDLTQAHKTFINNLYKRYRSQYEEQYPLPLKKDVKVRHEEMPSREDVQVRYEEMPPREDVKVRYEEMPPREDVKVRREELPLELPYHLSEALITIILDILSSQVAINDAERQILGIAMDRNNFFAETLYDLAYSIQYIDTLSLRSELKTAIQEAFEVILSVSSPM